ncbi:MAG: type II toxin-antitoxin system VapC family toxin [Planctomycetes bacterium]|nr:type II toxin-antitoxin system VapC family toxin [Planctomycetota bacterium]MBU4397801.1 type II toxin-antitoxin system VapC family toxin [Planctomycetota bacterium]MCG2684120.1 type II toxin-antitoxin system VapC family toxin [Planctomycetales bacterium]
MKKPLLLDTDVFVDYLRGLPEAVAFIKANVDRISLSTIVAAELYAGVRGEDELPRLDKLLSLFPVLPVTAAIARAGGLYKRDYSKSHGVGLADALIAATSEEHNAELKTFNVKHFPMLKNLKPPYGKE